MKYESKWMMRIMFAIYTGFALAGLIIVFVGCWYPKYGR